MADEIKVGMAEMRVGVGEDRLITYGLGSCVGLVIYDEGNRVGGLAHIMLPDSTQSTAPNSNPAKFADTAVKKLVEELVEKGASKDSLRAKVIGGAEMFPFSKTDQKATIGSRNVEAVKRLLGVEEIEIVGEDTGSNHGRTVELDVATGKVTVRTIGAGVIEI